MRQSKRSAISGKPEPAKPWDGFPLFPHASGRWAKKYRGEFKYFGPTKSDPDGKTALKRFIREWLFIIEGREVPPDVARDGCTIRELVNRFLTAKGDKLEPGELSAHAFDEFHRSCGLLVKHFGKDRRVDDLRPEDFGALRRKLVKGVNPVTLKSKVNRLRVVFKFAHDNGLILRPFDYGTQFDRPTAKAIRGARNEAGPRLFTAAEIRGMLACADPVMSAVLLLGVNCEFGTTDLARLPQSVVNLKTGWLEYPRPKTEIMRKIPLWPETIAALRDAIAARPRPAAASDAGLKFLTERGTPLVRVQAANPEEGKSDGRYVTISSLAKRFAKLMAAAGVTDRTFYDLRRTFETIAGD